MEGGNGQWAVTIRQEAAGGIIQNLKSKIALTPSPTFFWPV